MMPEVKSGRQSDRPQQRTNFATPQRRDQSWTRPKRLGPPLKFAFPPSDGRNGQRRGLRPPAIQRACPEDIPVHPEELEYRETVHSLEGKEGSGVAHKAEAFRTLFGTTISQKSLGTLCGFPKIVQNYLGVLMARVLVGSDQVRGSFIFEHAAALCSPPLPSFGTSN